jgi:hypothetical protein
VIRQHQVHDRPHAPRERRDVGPRPTGRRVPFFPLARERKGQDHAGRRADEAQDDQANERRC